MDRRIRYFGQKEHNSETGSDTKKSEVFHVTNIKKHHWGRRQEETKGKNLKRVKNRPTANLTIKGKVEPCKAGLNKFDRGLGVNLNAVKTDIYQKQLTVKENKVRYANVVATKADILLTEDIGYLEAGDGETTSQFTQKQLIDNIDVAAAAKAFELRLEFGPYRSRYTRNGRQLLLGGKMGHVAAFDWVTKKLHCEINVMESVHDVCWLHLETMFAVAQKNWVYIYDNQGIELHCVKKLNAVTRMEFLPYHFLLASCSDFGYLSWLDVSIGQIVGQYNTRMGQLSVFAQNPWNATICLGHAKGLVSLWAPTSRDPLAKMLCHKAPITALHVDHDGTYMVTAATNRELKIWDIRKLEGPVQEFKLVSPANNLAFSQRKLLAVGMDSVVQIYKNSYTVAPVQPYLRQKFPTSVGNFNFCPFEDVLGVSTTNGFTSLLVPGAGDANFDSMETNPYQSKSQRREAEVKALLEKIQPEMITLDPTIIVDVDIPTLRDKVEAKKELAYLKSSKITYEPRKKNKRKGVKAEKNKEKVRKEAKGKLAQQKRALQNNTKTIVKSKDVLDRFLSR